MLKPTFLIILLIPCISIFSQISIDFEDESLNDWEQSDSGHWEISEDNNISGDFSLHHSFDNSSSGLDQIALPIGQLDLTQPVKWEFKIRHGYNPSSSNNWSVFLFSDEGANQLTPSKNCNAYVVGVNFTGSDDFLKLWKKSNNNIEEIGNTNFNWEDSISINDYVNIEIIYSPPADWQISWFKNEDFNNKYNYYFTSTPIINTAQFFGLYYEYSSSQDRKLWFDDLKIDGHFILDTTSLSIKTIDVFQDKIELIFSEPIKHKSASKNSILIQPHVNYTLLLESSKKLTMLLDAPLEIDKKYLISIKNLEDISGNILRDTTLEIQYSVAKQNDIVISEIMTDPSPPVALPDQEFIELYNRTEKTFNLTNYSISVGEKNQKIESGKILPGEYIIICDDSDEEVFSDFGTVICVKSLPNLTKSTGKIVLRNNLGQLINQLEYSEDAYATLDKQNGGWTLEMIDTDNPCHFKNNWLESEDVTGGTPGRQNSIMGDNKDFAPPTVKNISVIDNSSIRVQFNEVVDSVYTSQNLSFGFDDITNYHFLDFKNVEASLSSPIYNRKLYETTISGVKDCASNSIDKSVYHPFAITESSDSLNIVFNELMFNPEVNEPEYIELINVSDKFIELNNLVLIKQSSSGRRDSIPITKSPALLIPEQILILTKNNDAIFNNYSINPETKYIEIEELPELTNSYGILFLCDTLENIIDVVEYNESMHFDLLNDYKGVALEKINIEKSSLEKSNWLSASASENYATPGWPNSQSFNYNSALYTPFTIEPEVFSPNGDGYNDELTINYEFNETGTVVNINIFDAKGRLINQLANNFLCGTQGEFKWRGENFDNQYALNGIYLIYIEYFTLDGTVNKKKETCVLAR